MNVQQKNRHSTLDIRCSALPSLLLIADGFTAPDVADRVVTAARAGVPWIQLRDHDASRKDFADAARDLTKRLRAEKPDVLVSINTRLEVAETLGAGVHAGKRGPDVAEAKKSGALTGFSAHDQDEAQRAAHDDADYVSFSPVFPTTSKPDHPSAGLAALRNVCAGVSIPVLALGGLTPERVAGCLDAGAHGVAVLSGILHADDPAGATAKYLYKLDNPK
ncbi:MAG: thiamine phosphate synthase [Bacteroidetes bacterium QS_8_64_10]|nr:MAG: thiamine phosphate synthase [Bacteroidetes bacterium QS_8_64_10]